MRKAISSTFILLILLLGLWGFGAWHLGINTEKNFNTFYEKKDQYSGNFFHLDLLEYDRSIFNSKVKIRLNLNEENTLAQFFQEIVEIEQEQVLIDIDIFHGPLLFNRKGLRLGSSAWKLKTDENFANSDTKNISKITEENHSVKAYIEIDFDDYIEYKIPLLIHSNEGLITGNYHPKTERHEGKLSIEQLMLQSNKQTLQSMPFALSYQQLAPLSDDKIQFELSGNIPNIVYEHELLPEKVITQLEYQGDISIKNNTLNTKNQLEFNFNNNEKDSNYPIEKGNLKFNISTLNLDHLLQLKTAYKQLGNLREQSQWILEEQGELPEGQDQIWQAQDNAAQLAQKLPLQLSKLILKDKTKITNQSINQGFGDNNSKLNFLFNSEYSNKQSSVTGAIYPDYFNSNNEHSDNSIFSLIQTHAQVELDEVWFQYLFTLLPIKKRNFNLIYKQNKLLMQ